MSPAPEPHRPRAGAVAVLRSRVGGGPDAPPLVFAPATTHVHAQRPIQAFSPDRAARTHRLRGVHLSPQLDTATAREEPLRVTVRASGLLPPIHERTPTSLAVVRRWQVPET